MILSHYSKDKIFSIVSTKNHQLIASFGSKGRSQEEFISPSSILEFSDDKGVIFSVFDFGSMELRKINVSESISQNRTISEKERISFKPISVVSSYQIDNENYLIDYVNDEDFCVYSAIWNTQTQEKSNDILTLESDEEIESFLISSINCISKDRDKYASAMMFLDQINILNIKEQHKSFSVSTSKEIETLSEINEIPMPDKMEYYCDIKALNDNIYALYIDRNRKDWALNEVHTKIHIINWKGNPIACLNLDRKIVAFDIDVENNVLYGLSASEDIYKYDLLEMRELIASE